MSKDMANQGRPNRKRPLGCLNGTLENILLKISIEGPLAAEFKLKNNIMFGLPWSDQGIRTNVKLCSIQ